MSCATGSSPASAFAIAARVKSKPRLSVVETVFAVLIMFSIENYSLQ
jgi:hypothetical protein